MEPVVLRALLVAALVVGVLGIGLVVRRREGRLRPTAGDGDGIVRLGDDHLEAVGLDLDGAEAGAVLLGSPTCAPCDTVKRVLGDLAEERDGFRWVYADAGEHLELAADHRVLRVPTLFVVAPGGRILARTSGVPRADDLRRVLDDGADLDGLAA
jgi:thiol-disulfide isomerase/thioredoxin